jgi:hypothetical protein
MKPRLWVRYKASPDELDVNIVRILIKDKDDAKILAFKWVDYEKRMGIGAFLDTLDQNGQPTPDGFITEPAGTDQTCEVGATNVEYFPDCRQSGPTPLPGAAWNVSSGITPIFNDCGMPARNVFTHDSTELTMEVQFDHLGPIFDKKAEDGTTTQRKEVKVIAEVCDIVGRCKSAEKVLPTGAD